MGSGPASLPIPDHRSFQPTFGLAALGVQAHLGSVSWSQEVCGPCGRICDFGMGARRHCVAFRVPPGEERICFTPETPASVASSLTRACCPCVKDQEVAVHVSRKRGDSSLPRMLLLLSWPCSSYFKCVTGHN